MVVRYAASTAVRRIADAKPTAVAQAVAGLSSPSPGVREGCEMALRDLYSESLVTALSPLVDADDPGASEPALRLLAPLALRVPIRPYRWREYHPALAPPPVRTERWSGTDRVLDTLRVAMSASSRPETRQRAVEALGDARDVASVPGLRKRLNTDADPRVRAAALSALAKVDPAAASVASIELLSVPSPTELRVAALAQLATRPAPGTAPVLLRSVAEGSVSEQRAALQALRSVPDPTHVPALQAAAASPALHDDAVRTLAETPDLRALSLYLDGLSSAEPAVVHAVRRALASLGADALPEVVKRIDSLPAGARQSLRGIYAEVPAARNSPLFASLPVADPSAYEAFATTREGDAWRGQILFFGGSGVACTGCHQVAGQGRSVGPDLTLAGKQFSRKEIIESILYPSRLVREGYRQTVVRTTDGRALDGMLRNETDDDMTIVALDGQSTVLPKRRVTRRIDSKFSVMPEGLHAGFSPEQFVDLVAFVSSRKSEPRSEPAGPLPQGFLQLFNGRDLTGWRLTDANRAHWSVKDGRLVHDGALGDLWTEQEFGDAEIYLEWRWSGPASLVDFPVIDSSGQRLNRDERVLDAGDSGVFLRGLYKAQANLFCYPVGSGEFWEYRESLDGDARRAVTPTRRADAPVGDWNAMIISLRGDRVTVTLNGTEVISNAALPGLPPRGPFGFQHEHGPLEIRAVGAKHQR